MYHTVLQPKKLGQSRDMNMSQERKDIRKK